MQRMTAYVTTHFVAIAVIGNGRLPTSLVQSKSFAHSHAVPGSQVSMDELALGQILHSLGNVQAYPHQHRHIDTLQQETTNGIQTMAS